jgi:hypothetical protein
VCTTLYTQYIVSYSYLQTNWVSLLVLNLSFNRLWAWACYRASNPFSFYFYHLPSSLTALGWTEGSFTRALCGQDIPPSSSLIQPSSTIFKPVKIFSPQKLAHILPDSQPIFLILGHIELQSPPLSISTKHPTNLKSNPPWNFSSPTKESFISHSNLDQFSWFLDTQTHLDLLFWLVQISSPCLLKMQLWKFQHLHLWTILLGLIKWRIGYRCKDSGGL